MRAPMRLGAWSRGSKKALTIFCNAQGRNQSSMSAFRHDSGGLPVTELSDLPHRERAKRYRELGRVARLNAANAKGDVRDGLIKVAGQGGQPPPPAQGGAEGAGKKRHEGAAPKARPFSRFPKASP